MSCMLAQVSSFSASCTFTLKLNSFKLKMNNFLMILTMLYKFLTNSDVSSVKFGVSCCWSFLWNRGSSLYFIFHLFRFHFLKLSFLILVNCNHILVNCFCSKYFSICRGEHYNLYSSNFGFQHQCNSNIICCCCGFYYWVFIHFVGL